MTSAEPIEVTRPRVRRAVLASGIGNLVEQYDFGVYGYLAPILASLFFPEASSPCSSPSSSPPASVRP